MSRDVASTLTISVQGDDLAVKDYGVELAVDMIQELWQEGVRGFHFCTLNLEKSVQRILENLDWIAPTERKSVSPFGP